MRIFIILLLIVLVTAEIRARRGSVKSGSKSKTINGVCEKHSYTWTIEDSNPDARPECFQSNCDDGAAQTRVPCKDHWEQFPDDN